MLTITGLNKAFGARDLFVDAQLQVYARDRVAIVGPNGSGKTTTVRMLAGLLEPSSGRVEYGGRRVDEDPVSYRCELGYVPEEPFLYPFLSGREYLELIGRLREIPEPLLAMKIDGFLGLFGLREAADQAIASYSKGMRQKIVIDTHKLCGLSAKGYAAQAKIHTHNFVGPSGKIYMGSKQGYPLGEETKVNDIPPYAGGYVMVYDPAKFQNGGETTTPATPAPSVATARFSARRRTARAPA